MAQLTQRLRTFLATSGVTSAETARVLLTSFEYAEASERDAIARALLETRRPEAIAGVIRAAHMLARETVDRLHDPSLDLDEPIAQVLVAQRPSATRNALRIIRRRADLRLLRHLADLLCSTDELAEQAGEVFLHVIVQHVGESGRRRLDPVEARLIDDAVTAALSSYAKHRNRYCLLAAAVVGTRPGPKLRALLDDPRSAQCLALRSVPRHLDEPHVQQNLIRWLTHPVLDAQVRRVMHQARGQMGDVLSAGHLLRTPARRRSVRRIDRPRLCLPVPAEATRLPEEAQCRLPDWTCALDLPMPVRIAALGDMVALADPYARLLAVTKLTAHAPASAAALGAIQPYCFDRDDAVARAAIRAVLAQEETNSAFLSTVAESDRLSTAQPARKKLAQLDAQHYFAHWLDLDASGRLIAAHRLLTRNRTCFLDRLRLEFSHRNCGHRLEATMLVRRLRIESHFSEELLVQSLSTDARIASAAVAALAHVVHAGSEDAARTALRHSNPRVRANAVEAITAWRGQPAIELVSPLMASRANRPRANAVRAMIEWKPDVAAEGLRSMLHDNDPLHRISALWVAGRSRVRELLADVAQLAEHDEHAPIRTRADAVTKSLRIAGGSRRRATAASPLPLSSERCPGMMATFALTAGTPMMVLPAQLDLELFRDGATSGGWGLFATPSVWAVALVVAAVAAGIAAVSDLLRRDRRQGGPAARALGTALGVSPADLRQLTHLANACRFPSAACLMISRGCFERAVRGRDDPEVSRLRYQLFSDDLESDHRLPPEVYDLRQPVHSVS